MAASLTVAVVEAPAVQEDAEMTIQEATALGRGKREVKLSLKAKESLEAAPGIKKPTNVKLTTEARKILAAEKKERGVATVATKPVLDE